MSPQERRAAVSLITQVLVFTVYAVYMLGYLEAGRLDAPDGLTFIARSVFVLIAGSIVVGIAVQILLALLTAIITRDDDQEMQADERDRMIDLKSMRVSHIAFAALFVITMGALALNFLALPTTVLLAIITAMFVSSTLGEATKLVLYRRGV